MSVQAKFGAFPAELVPAISLLLVSQFRQQLVCRFHRERPPLHQTREKKNTQPLIKSGNQKKKNDYRRSWAKIKGSIWFKRLSKELYRISIHSNFFLVKFIWFGGMISPKFLRITFLHYNPIGIQATSEVSWKNSYLPMRTITCTQSLNKFPKFSSV